MLVYVVTSGAYSDYGIDQIFTNKKQAELFCAVHNSKNPYGYDCHVEEWATDEVKLEGEVYYGVKVLAHKTRSDNLIIDCAEELYSTKPIVVEVTTPNNGGYFNCTIPTTQAHDNEQRKKIAEDYLAKMQAEKEGLI